MRAMWRIAVVLLAVGCAQPAVRPEPKIAPSPEGWWIETAETMNQRDVGQALRFTATELTIIRKEHFERLKITVVGTAPGEWTVETEQHKTFTLRQNGQQLSAKTEKDSADLRKATADEVRHLEEVLAKAPARTPIDPTPDVSQ